MGSGSLLMDGVIEGSINLRGDRVTLGRHSQVAARITAGELVVHGEVRGDLRVADLITICSDGSMTGDVTAARILIEDGAFLNASVDARQNKTETSVPAAPRLDASQPVGFRQVELLGKKLTTGAKVPLAKKHRQSEGRQSRQLESASCMG